MDKYFFLKIRSENEIYRMIIRARRKSRINAKTKNGQSKIKAIARRRKPDNGNHRDKD
jgi:hypothetical protein